MSPPLIMGIINVTPDSFSGDGLLFGPDYVDRAVARAGRLIRHGADILDIGGESSRPGAAPVAADEEIRRVVPVVEAIKNKLGSVRLSVDTVKASVAEEALKAGAEIVNDVSALGDAKMGAVVARYDAQIVLMHNRADTAAVTRDRRIGGQYDAPTYGDFIADIARALQARADIALNEGIAKDKIILDPGLGFGKTPEQNMALIAQLEKIKVIGFPVLVGPSRKSFIGRVLDMAVEERVEGTAACVAVSVFKGADIVRVHDVKFMARVAQMSAALKKSESL